MQGLDCYIALVKEMDVNGLLRVVLFDKDGAYDFKRSEVTISKEKFENGIKSKSIYPINYNIESDKGFRIKSDETIFKIVASSVRKCLEEKIGTGTDLAGHCIEASSLIESILKELGFDAKSIEGWCSYDDECYGSDRPYDEHTWVECNGYYIDATADQFNPGMDIDNNFNKVIVHKGLIHNMSYEEPEYEDEDEDNEY